MALKKAFGTTAFKHQHVLEVENNNLLGRIPPSLGQLCFLQKLSLSFNPLGGCIPDAIGSLSRLRELYLIDNQLTGNIPAALGRLSSLQVLRLDANLLTGAIPVELGNLSSLQELWLDRNQLTGTIPDAFGNLTNLVALDIYHNQLTGPIPVSLGNLSALQLLHLDENQLSETIPTEIGNLPALRILHLQKNFLEGEIPASLLRRTNFDFIFSDNRGLTTGECITLEVPQFPFYVVSREVLLRLNRLETHEFAKKMDNLTLLKPFYGQVFFAWQTEEFVRVAANIRRENLVFFSHRWLTPHSNPTLAHPDDENNSKLAHMQRLAGEHPEWRFFWIDYLCVPQENPGEQQKAINSLPHYVKSCGIMVTLCGNTGQSCIDVYQKRGWCRLEQLSSKIPVPKSSEDFFETVLFIANKDEGSFEQIRNQLSGSDLNPLEGIFFDDSDRPRVRKCIAFLCEYMLAGEQTELFEPAQHIIASKLLNPTCPESHGPLQGSLSSRHISGQLCCNLCETSISKESADVWFCQVCEFKLCDLCAYKVHPHCPHDHAMLWIRKSDFHFLCSVCETSGLSTPKTPIAFCKLCCFCACSSCALSY